MIRVPRRLWPVLVLPAILLAHPAPAQPNLLRNPGFEEVDAAGQPVGWAKFREAFIDDEPSLAHTGRGSVRSSFLYGWQQPLAVPADGRQGLAVVGKAAVEFDFQQARVRVPFWDATGAFIRDGQGDSPVTTGTRFGDFWAPVVVAPGAARAELYLAGRSPQEWVRFDDLRIFLERFAQPGDPFGEPWAESGSALADAGGTVILPDASGAVTQHVVGIPDGRRYFVTADWRASGEAGIAVEEVSVPRNQLGTTVTRGINVPLRGLTGSLTAHFARWEPSLSPRVAVSLRNSASEAVELTALSRGFTRLSATTVTVGAGSIDTSLTLTAAWPAQLRDATVDITGPSGYAARPPMSRDGTTAQASWLDPDAPTGRYNARFELVSTGGRTITLDEEFEVRGAETLPEVPPLSPRVIANVGWLYLRYDEDDARTRRTLALAKSDGFQSVILHLRADQLDVVRRTCESLRLPFIIQLDDVRAMFAQSVRTGELSEAAFRERLDELLRPVSRSRLYRGVYLVDEPTQPAELAQLGALSRALARPGAPGPGFSVLTDQATTDDLRLASTAVWLVDVYPFASRNPRDNADAVLAEIPRYNTLAKAAANEGRPFWLLPQAFESDEFDFFRAVPVATHSAQLGAAVLAGARGFMPFLYTSVGNVEGMRGPDLTATPKLAAYRDFARILRRISPVLADLSTPELDDRLPRPLAASTATHPRLGRFLFVLNADELAPRTVRIGLDRPLRTAYVTDLVSGRRVVADRRTTLTLTIQPGAWVMLPLGRSAPAAYQMDVPPPPALGTLNLPVVTQFTAKRPNGTPLALRGAEFDDFGNLLALSLFRDNTEFLPPPVYQVGLGGAAQFALPPMWSPVRNGFTAGTLCITSANLGLRQYLFPPSLPPILRQFSGYTGGAFDCAATYEDGMWLTMLGYGVRQMRFTGGRYESLATGLSRTDFYMDLHGGLFSGGSATAVVRGTGLANIKQLALDDEFQLRTPIPRTAGSGSDMSSSRVLAIPRLQRGVMLVRLDEFGETIASAELEDGITETVACAWLHNGSILAVTDSIYCVRFYRVSPDLTVRPVGTWRPQDAGHLLFTGLAGHETRLAVTAFDGRVFVVDTAQMDE